MRTHKTHRPAAVFLAALLTTLLSLGAALADPYHAPTIDGTITADDVDWSEADRVLTDEHDYEALDSGDFYRLYVTWSADSLYVGADWLTSNRTAYILFDLDRDGGVVSAADLDSLPVDVSFTDGRTIDLVIAREHAQFNDAGTPKIFLVGEGGACENITAETNAVQTFSLAPPSRFPAWYQTEIAIPWSLIHPDGPPAYATLSAVGVISNPTGGVDGEDTAPDNPGEGAAGTITVENMHVSILDPDGDGDLDPLDASISGVVTLPDNPGGISATISAELLDWAGGDLDDPVSSATSSSTGGTYRLGRLPAGDYDVTYEADGYFPTTESVTIGAGQTLDGRNVTLNRATTISGTLSLELGQYRGGFTFRDAGGDVLQTRTLLPSQFPYDFAFYVNESGTYSIEAWAENHLGTTFPLVVVAGEDLLDQDLQLPRAPLISGRVVFNTGEGADGTVTLGNAAGDSLFSTAEVSATEPGFSFYAPRLGDLRLSAVADTYGETDVDVTAVAGVDLTDIAIDLARQPGLLGNVAFVDGPGNGGSVYVTGEAVADTLAIPSMGGAFGPVYHPQGDYEVVVDIMGYDLWTGTVPLTANDSVTDLGTLTLAAARATALRLVDETGAEIVSLSATKSIPEIIYYKPTAINLEAVDDAGRRDVFDLDGKLTGLELTARKMDDRAPARGSAWFLGSYAEDNVDDIIETVDVTGGTTRFWFANEEVEVLRVFVGPDVPEPLKQAGTPPTARFMVGFNDPKPATVVLHADRDTLMAHADSSLTITAQLYDSAGNESKQEEIISFTTVTGTDGTGTFDVSNMETNANGYAEAVLRGVTAGELLVDCSVVIDNTALEVRLEDADGEEGPLPIVVIPGPTVAWDLGTASSTSSSSSPVGVTIQTIDAFGNETEEPDVTVMLSADPATLGSFSNAAPVTDEGGRAATEYVPAGSAGVVTLTATSADYTADDADLELRNVAVVTDPAYEDEAAGTRCFEAVDLTALIIDNGPDEIEIDIPFSSNWTNLRFFLLFETNWDAAGGGANPFDFPVLHGHADKPDYSLDIEFDGLFGDASYADLRRWEDGSWGHWWDTDAEEYVDGYNDNVRLEASWLSATDDGLHLTIPWAPFGDRPDSLRCELYVTHKDGDTSRSAFDSVPEDATLNLNWDPDDEDVDWTLTTMSRTLSNWSPTYVVKTDFPTPPTLSNLRLDPSELDAGAPFVFQARVSDAGDGVGDVLADLSDIAGSALARMYDDGLATHGDANAGDGTYSLQTTVPLASLGGERTLSVQAFDASNMVSARADTTAEVTPQVDIIVQALDAEGDDHGPDQAGVEGFYYTYPTNSVFVTGAFDILGLNIYETVSAVGSGTQEMIAFEVSVGDFPDPDEAHTADWNPPYGDLNIQKIDIMIDTGAGGSTRGLPNRRIDFQKWNAWDYAIVMDGWYKAVVPSLSNNTEDAWLASALLTDADITLTGDFDRDVITALVSKSALGNPTPEDIESWSIAVLIMSHDGDSDFGGVRNVNESRSEWNQGGGHYDDYDPNVMDLLMIPGAGRDPGRTQSEMLDYESESALRRLEDGETPCLLEMSAFEDTGPPVIEVVKDYGEVMLREPLEDAPIAFSIEITDDNEVGLADFSYRSTKPGEALWEEQDVSMGYVGDDYWSVDLPAAWLDTALVVSPIDQMRYVEFEIYAEDIDYLDYVATGTQAPVTTVQVMPAQDTLSIREVCGASGVGLRHVEGSTLEVDEDLASDLVTLFREATGTAISADSLATALELDWEISNVEPTITSAPRVPRATPLGIYRRVELELSHGDEAVALTGELPRPLTLGLHYTDAHLPAGKTEAKVAMYEYLEASDRWLLLGGHVNERANRVITTVDHAGIYGLFWTDEISYDTDEVISGITVSPNPFSPNGDGLYDRTNISFYLTQEATVTVEVYNIEGSLKERLTESFPYSGEDDADNVPRRVEGLIWDGTGENGEYVPYGIYILRLIVTYNQAGGERTIRSNHPVAVIR